jgi:hypothetical protein
MFLIKREKNCKLFFTTGEEYGLIVMVASISKFKPNTFFDQYAEFIFPHQSFPGNTP